MDIIENKTVDALTTDSVSILTRKYVKIDGIPTQVGENHRQAYENSEKGRISIQENEPKEVVNAVFAIWGDTPTIDEPTIEETEENSKQ